MRLAIQEKASPAPGCSTLSIELDPDPALEVFLPLPIPGGGEIWRCEMSKRFTLLVLAVLCLAAAPAFAAVPVLPGIDAWTTVPEGTYANLVNNPLPAGFLCDQFPGFSGFIYLNGIPLMSDQGLLSRTDTIVERLDRAVFNKAGVALTRVRVRALQLTGVETLKTVCGEFKVDVTLDGEQPLSTMRIVRTTTK